MLVLARRFEKAMEEGRRILDLDPHYYLGYFLLGCGYRYLGNAEEAIAAQRKAVELSQGAAWMLGWLGLTLGSTGDTNGASTVLRQLHDMQMKHFVPPSSIAWVHLGLKQIDTAFKWLNRAVDERDQLMMPIKSYAFFDPLRSDPRFHALLKKMNLEQQVSSPATSPPGPHPALCAQESTPPAVQFPPGSPGPR
jgi:tetratricopeptide (TPR) repeat protein